jgi:CheY-like chemotaxis protein
MSDAPLVLVCDDTRPIAASIVLLLQSAGYRAQPSGDALDAVSIARKDRPALILMDIMMPGLDGATASELMREYPELEGIPIVLLSAMPEEEVRTRAQACGAVGYLLKPFRKGGLLETVRRWVPDPLPAKQPV